MAPEGDILLEPRLCKDARKSRSLGQQDKSFEAWYKLSRAINASPQRHLEL